MYVSSQITYPKLTSDSLVVITPQQLKATNLIFLEHKRFKIEKKELLEQINSYELMTANLIKSDSIRVEQLQRSKLQLQIYGEALQTEQKKLKKTNRKIKRLTTISIGGCAISVGLFAILLLK